MKHVSDKHFLIALYAYPAFGPARLTLLINYFSSAKKVWSAAASELKEVGLSPKVVEKFVQFRDSFDIRNYFAKLAEEKIGFTVKGSDDYPTSLNGLSNAPLVLYFQGKIDILNAPCVAIVGTRKMTGYGREVAQRLSSELVQAGVVVVSGLARGIDTAAHKAALEVGGKTAAVIGSGFGKIYPPENTNLSKVIAARAGVVLSEYPLDYPAIPVNFANRNRIISGLSSAVVVVEGAKKSGTLLTATHAAEQGKTVFAVPGQITSPMSEAPHFLLKNGAKAAYDTGDILAELDLEMRVNSKKASKILPDTKEEQEICQIIANEALGVDDIIRQSGFEASMVRGLLTMMELKGLVRNEDGKYIFQIN